MCVHLMRFIQLFANLTEKKQKSNSKLNTNVFKHGTAYLFFYLMNSINIENIMLVQ